MKRGPFLIKLRTKVGLSQSDVANELGYSPQLISLWEKDRAHPDLRVASKYAKILGVDLDGFINCKETKKNNYCEEKDFDIDKFSKNLRFLRKQNNLLQSNIANKLGTNTKTIGSWENGFSTPTIENFVSLCALYNKTLNELYFVCEETPVEETIATKKKSNSFFSIFLSIIVLLVLGGAGTGIALGITNKNQRKQPSFISETSVIVDSETESIEESSEEGSCEHQYSSERTNPTYDSDGSIVYTCIKCGDTYTEVLPKLEHIYSETWSFDRAYHYHQCTDEGYVDLIKDKEAHDFIAETTDGVTTYHCSKCEYSYSTSDYIIVLDVYNEDGEHTYSVSQRNHLYLKVLNNTKYPLKALGYAIKGDGDNPAKADGPFELTECLDEPNYTLFDIGDFPRSFPGICQAGHTVTLSFSETYLDPDLLGVTCEDIVISIIE